MSFVIQESQGFWTLAVNGRDEHQLGTRRRICGTHVGVIEAGSA